MTYFERQDLHELVKRAPLSVAPPSIKRSTSKEVADRLHLLDPSFKDQWHLVNDGHPEHTMNTTPVLVLGFSDKDVLVSCIDGGLYFEADDLKEAFIRHCVISTTAGLFLFLTPSFVLGCRELLRLQRPHVKLMALGVRAKWQLGKTMNTTRKLLVPYFRWSNHHYRRGYCAHFTFLRTSFLPSLYDWWKISDAPLMLRMWRDHQWSHWTCRFPMPWSKEISKREVRPEFSRTSIYSDGSRGSTSTRVGCLGMRWLPLSSCTISTKLHGEQHQ